MIKKLFKQAKDMASSTIALKLSLNFAMALLIFSIIVGSVFMILFRNHTLQLHKTELESRANSIASTLSSYMDRGNTMGGMGMGGYGAYIRFIGDIARTDVWIVDRELNLITGGKSMMGGRYNYKDLPQNAGRLINKVFTDKTEFSEDFSSLLSELTLTVGVPIKNNAMDVVGVVLLHSPVHGTDEAIFQGFIMLGISIVTALIISIILSIAYSYSFTKPLNKMKVTAHRLAEGDYSAQNNIKQKDEIGQLANTMDVLAEKLDNASRQSAALEQMRRDFVANISHELRTPITVIRGSLEALVDKIVTEPDKIEDYHVQMLNEAKFLQRLVGDLLELSKLQNVDFVIDKSEISLCDIMDDIARSAEQLAKRKSIKLIIKKSSENYNIIGDYGRLRQMFMIVIDNAIKFSDENSFVEVVFENNRLLIKDYGIGISKEHLPFIFDRFYKTRSEHNKTGTGLGLAIAKQIADRHNINLSCESIEGEYTSFIFKF